MVRVRALIAASHLGPCLAITAMATVLAAEAAPHGIGPVLTAPAMLAGQLSVGWSNDACDAPRDIAAGRADKPLGAGRDQRARRVDRGVRLARGRAGAGRGDRPGHDGAAGPARRAPAWAYNLGLKSTPWSGAMYLLGFGPLPAYAARTLPGQPGGALLGMRRGGPAGAGRALRERAARPGGRPQHRGRRPAAARRGALGPRRRPGRRPGPAAVGLGPARGRGEPGAAVDRGRRAVRLAACSRSPAPWAGAHAVPRRARPSRAPTSWYSPWAPTRSPRRRTVWRAR